jgi:RNA polymerase sigma-70 factor (ECF subfamily)
MAGPTHPTIEQCDGSSPTPSAGLHPHQPVKQNGHDDERSFDDLFRAYYTSLCAYARRLVKRADIAEELVADVFVRLWERREEWQTCGNQKGYLYAAARNQALKYLAH